MSFGRMVQNYKRKTKLDSQEIWSKVKVTGQGFRGQITIKNDLFLGSTSITQKVIDRF